jgi:hypothetical protein
MAPGTPPEPEPTALAAIALDDAGARDWLAAAQGADGSVALRVGPTARDLSALASLALADGTHRERALDHLQAAQASQTPDDPTVPHDPATRGWPWTIDTFGWVEPTSWALLALRRFRPAATEIDDAIAVLADRECRDGGWNYGNPEAFGVPLPPFAQTTAIALLALQGSPEALSRRGLKQLRVLLETEGIAPLSAATSAVALRLCADPRWERAAALALESLNRVAHPDAISLAWVALAGADAGRVEAFAHG